MNIKQSRINLSGLVLLLTVTACALPGQTLPSTPDNIPDMAETSIAGTAQVAAQQTEQAGLVTTTSTVAPTETPIPTPQISLSGTSLILREDQSAEFIDHKAGIKLIIPAGWMAVRVNEAEFYKAFATTAALENPPIFDRLNQIQTHDVNFLRLSAIDIRPGHIVNGLISDISVIFQEDDVRTLEEWEQAERQRNSPFSGFKFISSNYYETANGIRVLEIEESWDYLNGTLYYKGVFFSLDTGTVVLDFQTSNDFKDTVIPDFVDVVNGLTLLSP